MEAPERSDAVVLPASGQHSRPGPAFGCREGVFQSSSPGEYILPSCAEQSILPENAPLSSTCLQQTISALRIYYQNAGGLRTKVTDFFLAVLDRDYDVIVIVETWLTMEFTAQQLFGDHYNVFWKHRDPVTSGLRRGGGILIAVSDRFSSHPHPDTSNTHLEQLWVIVEGVQRNVCIGAYYVRPTLASISELNEDHVNSAASVAQTLGLNDTHIILGDYNQPGIRWTRNRAGYAFPDPDRSSFSCSSSTLLDGMTLNGMCQMNTITDYLDHTLDLAFINSDAVPSCQIEPALEALVGVDCHHPPFVATLTCPIPVHFNAPVEDRPYCFYKTDFVVLNEALSAVDWSTVENAPNVDVAVTKFNEILHALFRLHVPPPTPRFNPPWSNERLRKLKQRRAAALRRFTAHRNPMSKRAFCLASNRYRWYKRFRYSIHIQRTQRNLKKNPKSFWSFVNGKRKETGLPSCMFLGDSSSTSVNTTCNLFAEHFSSVFNHDVASDNQVNEALQTVPANVLNFNAIEFSIDDVKIAAAKLKSTCAAGPDGIPSIILRRCAEPLAKPLCAIFNMSIASSLFPVCWKKSFLMPVFKKGDKRDISNYRGITSLCAGSKLMEILLCKHLSFAMKSYISADQHGFFPGRSTSTNLVEFASFCLRNMEGGGQVDAVYTNLKAAFDRINHRILLAKLDRLGMPHSLVRWFESYLSDRILTVKLGNAESADIPRPSGVPQGSNIGPMGFSVYYNDVSLALPAGCRLLYADDLKLFQVVRNPDDCRQLQNLIDTFARWCAKNLMSPSILKCSVISFTRKKHPLTWTYTIDNTPLERVTVVKDLGVLLDCQLSYDNHYSSIIAKANRNLGFMFRMASEFRDTSCLRALYCALVRSHLESAVLVWCPYEDVWITRIEAIQRKFTRFALRTLPLQNPDDHVPYQNRCQFPWDDYAGM